MSYCHCAQQTAGFVSPNNVPTCAECLRPIANGCPLTRPPHVGDRVIVGEGAWFAHSGTVAALHRDTGLSRYIEVRMQTTPRTLWFSEQELMSA